MKLWKYKWPFNVSQWTVYLIIRRRKIPRHKDLPIGKTLHNNYELLQHVSLAGDRIQGIQGHISSNIVDVSQEPYREFAKGDFVPLFSQQALQILKVLARESGQMS